MHRTFLAVQSELRLGAFAGILALMAIWEALAPRRARAVARARRWPGNLGVVLLDSVLLRLIVPVSAVALGGLAEARGWGMFAALGAPRWLAIAGSVVLLDLVIYLQHVLFHAAPSLWRIHRMHHSDTEFDVTTALRFHPIEIVLSMLIKLAAVAALGAPAIAVLIFEIVLNGGAMFNHANAWLPPKLDRVLRWMVVTPDMHRVHHSIVVSEANSNFGFSLSWWDRLFGTYRAQPAAGHAAMTIGIDAFREPGEMRLDRMVIQPFRGAPGRYPLGRREG